MYIVCSTLISLFMIITEENPNDFFEIESLVEYFFDLFKHDEVSFDTVYYDQKQLNNTNFDPERDYIEISFDNGTCRSRCLTRSVIIARDIMPELPDDTKNHSMDVARSRLDVFWTRNPGVGANKADLSSHHLGIFR